MFPRLVALSPEALLALVRLLSEAYENAERDRFPFAATLAVIAAVLLIAPVSASAANPHTAFTGSTDQCLSCHSLHEAPTTVLPIEQRYLFKQPSEKQLCYVCHDGTSSTFDVQSEFGESVLNTSTRTSDHGADAQSCRSCHTPHRGPSEGNPMSLASTTPTSTVFCGRCHGADHSVGGYDLVTPFRSSAHETSMGGPASGSAIRCLRCHAPHGSDNRALISQSVTSLAGVARTVSATTGSGPGAVCLACHDVSSGTYKGTAAYGASKHGSVKTSVAALTTMPVSVGASGAPGWQKANDCENCHDPHGSAGGRHLTNAEGDELCFSCHDGAGTVKPSGYSYRGRFPYLASGHASMTASEAGTFRELDSRSDGFEAYESTTLPTPASPGTTMTAEKAARLASLDSSYAVTALANVTGQHDYQAYRFKPGVDTRTMQIAWSGYGEDFAGYETSVSVWSKSAGAGGWVSFARRLMPTRSAASTTVSDPSDVVDADGYTWVLAASRKVRQSDIVSGPTVTFANGTSAVITWQTRGAADGWVDYGLTTAYGSTVGTSTRTASHTATLTLSSLGHHNARVRGTAAAGDTAASGDVAFTNIVPIQTPVADQGGLAVEFDVPFAWDMPDQTYAPFTYDLHIWSPSWYDETFNALTATSTVRTLTTIPEGSRTYYWQVRAHDAAGFVSSWSPIDTFVLTDDTDPGSCPFLFTWDGSAWRFEADVMMPGKLANKVASGYQKPNPQDAYKLRATPGSVDGSWRFKLVEERREVDYMDRLQLFAADTAEGYEVFAEKPGVGGTLKQVREQLHTVRDPYAPLSATHVQTARDVLGSLAADDGDRLVLNEDREDFTYQTIELDLGVAAMSAPQVKLLIEGVSAFFQTPAGLANSVKYGPRTKLEVQQADGSWYQVPASELFIPVPPEFARTYVVDVTRALTHGGPRIRLTFLYKTYIDVLKVDVSPDQPITLTEAPLEKADLSFHGIDGRSSDDPDIYEYVYGRDLSTETTFFAGAYTRYGDVVPLLADVDDRFAVAGPGDELDVTFRALPDPAPGVARSLILGTHGYYKDTKNDLPRTVEPLPFSAMTNYPYPADEHYPDDEDHRTYLSEWNTRLDGIETSGAGLGVASFEQVDFSPVARIARKALHRSLNVDTVRIDVSSNSPSRGAGCTACHAVHGGGAGVAEGKPSLNAVPSRLCTSEGNGGCHSSAANAVGGSNIHERLTASTDPRNHHDVMLPDQLVTGARITCTDCHDPHIENRSAHYADPLDPTVSIATTLGPYVDASGTVYALVGAMHDAVSPLFTVGPTISPPTAATWLTPTVSWTTNEGATSWVDWGTSPGVYTMVYGSGSFVFGHGVQVTGLEPETLYYWRVRTVDALGNESVSAEGTYLPTLAPLTFVAGPTLTAGWSDYLAPPVAWTTSDYTNGILEWGTASGSYTATRTDPVSRTGHTLWASVLTSGTVYYWRVHSYDAAGRHLVSAEATYRAGPPPPPVLTQGPTASGNGVWSTYATPTITWRTSDTCGSWVDWGTSPGSYDTSAGNNSLVLQHSMQVPGLTWGTTYYYRVRGLDRIGRPFSSGESTYVPTPPPPAAITAGPTLSGGTYLEPTFTWNTSDIASAYLEWGTASGVYGSSSGTSALVSSCSATMTGLAEGTVYYWRVRGDDRLGRPYASAEATYDPVPFPSAPTLSLSYVPYVDSSGYFYPTTTSVTATWTASTASDGDPMEYRLLRDGVPLSGWQSSPTFVFSSGAGTWGVYVEARDAGHTWIVVRSNVVAMTVTDTYDPGGSCPFLYVWDGSTFRFLADLNTSGKIGGVGSKGYQNPDPRDRYVLPTDPVAKDGQLELRIVEERQEVDYTDEFKLYTVDLPEGLDLYAEKGERGGGSPLPPAGLHTVEDLRAPLSIVRTDTGEDVADALAAVDGTYVQLNEDANVGFEYKTLEFDLGDVSAAERVKIVMNAQSKRPYTPEGVARQRTFPGNTKFEVQDTSGAWRSVPASEGSLPNAMEFERSYIFDITRAMHDTTGRVRFTYLCKTYIDFIGFDTSVDVPVTITEVPLRSAVLGNHGVDARTSWGDVYEYVYGPPIAPSRYFPGAYTRFGDVTPLLSATDDKFVIYAQGDEMTLRFDEPAPPAPGTDRSYVAFIDGYYKSIKSDVTHTVEPLPFAAMSNFPYGADESYPTDEEHEDYRREYNTRIDGVESEAGPLLSSLWDAVRPQARPARAVAAFGAGTRPRWWAAVPDSRRLFASRSVPVPSATPANAVHYSVNTDASRLEVSYSDDSVVTTAAVAGWYAARATSSAAPPSPSDPGTPATPAQLAAASSVDATYWITDDAVAEGAWNYQLMRLEVPSERHTGGIKDVSFVWTGHGEPTASHPTTVALWNFTASRWDTVASGVYGADVSLGKANDTSDRGASCLKCHTASQPAGVVMPAGIVNVASVWSPTTSAGNFHGARSGGGFGSGGLLGYQRGASPIGCAVCHDPHGSANLYHIPATVNGRSGIQVRNGNEVKNLCYACHTGNVAAWHAECNACHDDDYGYGHWGDATGYTPSEGVDCLPCHGHNRGFSHGGDPCGHCHGWNPTWQVAF